MSTIILATLIFGTTAFIVYRGVFHGKGCQDCTSETCIAKNLAPK
jgi:hypothetical protein